MTWRQLDTVCLDKMLVMIFAIVTSLRHLLGWVVSAFRSRADLTLENLALRQQLLSFAAEITSLPNFESRSNSRNRCAGAYGHSAASRKGYSGLYLQASAIS